MGFGDTRTEQQQAFVPEQQQAPGDKQLQQGQLRGAEAAEEPRLLLEGPLLVTLPAQPFVFVRGDGANGAVASENAWRKHNELPRQFKEQFMFGSAAVGSGLWGTTSQSGTTFACRAGRCVANLPPAAMPLPPSIHRGVLAGGLYSSFTMYGDSALLAQAWETAIERSGTGIAGAVLQEDKTRDRLAHYFSTPQDPRGAIDVSVIHLYIPVAQAEQQQQGMSAVEFSLTEPELLEMEPFRMIFVEERGKFAQIAHPLWEKFHRDLLPSLPSTSAGSTAVAPGLQKVATALIRDEQSDDVTGFGGIYRAGAIMPPGFPAPQKLLDQGACEDTIHGAYLRFTLLGDHRHLPQAWSRCLAAAKQHKLAASVDTAVRPCVEMYLNYDELNAASSPTGAAAEFQRTTSTLTELLVPITIDRASPTTGAK